MGGTLFDGSILLIMGRSVTERVGIHLAGNVRRRVPSDGNHLGHDGNRDLFRRDRSDLASKNCHTAFTRMNCAASCFSSSNL